MSTLIKISCILQFKVHDVRMDAPKEVNRVPEKEIVDSNHYRVTTDDGRKSYLYETDGWSDHCIEVADHHEDGTTDAYEVDSSISGVFFHDGKGKHK